MITCIVLMVYIATNEYKLFLKTNLKDFSSVKINKFVRLLKIVCIN